MLILRSQDSGTVKVICREISISDATFYNWKAKYGGIEASVVFRMKDLQDENVILKLIVTDLTLEIYIVKTVLENLPACRKESTAA